uniref:Uncharacterized protein n=1 Tax=Pseudictyota dubia TaxID=2749911 RepID=A0A7R9Z849_9STRA|eukprot:CAMPEP_0197440178 /NCGR_PEP_ID=MMETSP1175-20131217/6746_1 /TAXON_ID=1003142 /ORGANISM="Triceratium dubium, Strain CCMP147" /LENGTH=180 /DNA_ID=CAMNT_0042970239 /DNA_START=88 /DNA_END=630 /DNA_ORIENTATION=+
MALRLVSQRLFTQSAISARKAASASLLRAANSTAVASSTATSELPSVHDVMINLTFVDPSGARRKVPGIIGKTLYDISEMHGIELGPASVGGAADAIRSDTWTEPLFGEGPCTGFDHVLLVGPGVETAKPRDHIEMRMLNHYWDDDEIFPESRLATQITLTKKMDGMTVYVPDRICDDIP